MSDLFDPIVPQNSGWKPPELTHSQADKLDAATSALTRDELLKLVKMLVLDLVEHDGLVEGDHGPWGCKRPECEDPACPQCGGTNRLRSSELLTRLVGPYTKKWGEL